MSRRLVVLATVAAVAVSSVAFGPGTGAAARGNAVRDPWRQPFRPDSIWNMPIGSAARYVDAELPSSPVVEFDPVLLVRTRRSDPERPLLHPGDWQHRCAGTASTGSSIRVPDAWLVPDARQEDGAWITPNNVAAFLEPDGRTMLNTNAVARCDRAGPVHGYTTGDPRIDRTDLYGDGRLGARGGSRLSGIGGTLRRGELDGDGPIRHALQLLVWGRYLWWGDDADSCFRWPAETCDANADDGSYQGTNQELRMGSLLAIEPSARASSLGIETDAGKKLFAALRDYGAYITDNSAWDAYYLGIEDAALGSLDWGTDEQEDLRRLITALHVVANNGPSSVGGGGKPRCDLLSPLHAPTEG